jgi:crotonobetaine/carnitine-CoA ligase
VIAVATEDRTLPRFLEQRADAAADAPFLVDELGSLTWGAAFEQVRRVAAGLGSLGVEPGDTVAIAMANRREFVLTWFAVNWLGAIEVPVSPSEVGERLHYQLNHSRARVLVVDGPSGANLDSIGGAPATVETVVTVDETGRTGWRLFQDLADAAPIGRRTEVHPSDPAAVLYTSGSTGPPKGVVVSHGQHATNGLQPRDLFGIDGRDILYLCLPLHHNMAQGYGVWPALASGAAVRLSPKFSIGRFWAEIVDSGATILPFVGAMLVLLAKQAGADGVPEHHLRLGYGVPIPPDLLEAFERTLGMELVHCYGSTEATIVAWDVGADRVVGSVGRVLPDFEVQIVDDRDEPVDEAVTGEICVRPRVPWSMFSGYLHDPQRTVHAWRNLWFHTGDRGLLRDGRLWFIDRLGDTIRRRGEAISALEVENVLLSHPAVELAAVFAVPSELTEDEIMAAVIRRPHCTATAAELRAWCFDKVAAHAVPRFIELVESLPMTSTGKIEKYKLTARGVTPATDDGLAAD